MAIRRLYGTGTADAGIFWEDLVNEGGWRVQYNKTLSTTKILKPYRLLDPSGNLWASADGCDELFQNLPGLVSEFSAKEPLFSSAEAKSFVKSALVFAVSIGVDVAKEKYAKQKENESQ